MERSLIWRGALAGAVGGLLAFIFARILAEPLIQRAIDYEEGRAHAQAALDQAAGLLAEHEHGEQFSRFVQGNVGLGAALILFGAALGALFAVAYAVCLGRAGGLRPRVLAVLVAGGGFLTLYLVPFLKYPANPPAIGNDATIRARGGLYLLMVGASVVLLVLSVWLGKRLQPRLGTWNATLAAAGVFVAATAILMVVLPSYSELAANRGYRDPSETPGPLTDPTGQIVFPGFPADLLFSFRVYSLGAQLIMWAAIGLVFAPLAERLLARSSQRRQPVTAA